MVSSSLNRDNMSLHRPVLNYGLNSDFHRLTMGQLNFLSIHNKNEPQLKILSIFLRSWEIKKIKVHQNWRW